MMDFSQALVQLKAGENIRRTGWNAAVYLREGNGTSDPPGRWVAYVGTKGGVGLYRPTSADLFATDWVVVAKEDAP